MGVDYGPPAQEYQCQLPTLSNPQFSFITGNVLASKTSYVFCFFFHYAEPHLFSAASAAPVAAPVASYINNIASNNFCLLNNS
jgi:hypothetical protein